jgi:hypothetical protein
MQLFWELNPVTFSLRLGQVDGLPWKTRIGPPTPSTIIIPVTLVFFHMGFKTPTRKLLDSRGQWGRLRPHTKRLNILNKIQINCKASGNKSAGCHQQKWRLGSLSSSTIFFLRNKRRSLAWIHRTFAPRAIGHSMAYPTSVLHKSFNKQFPYTSFCCDWYSCSLFPLRFGSLRRLAPRHLKNTCPTVIFTFYLVRYIKFWNGRICLGIT